MLIKSYGLHWKRDDVYWGEVGRNKKGRLLGRKVPSQAKPGSKKKPASRKRSLPEVDFREQRGIYVLYRDYEVIYVGQAGAGGARLFKRLNDHRTDHLAGRWNRFSWFGTRGEVGTEGGLSKDSQTRQASTSTVLNHLEAILIEAIQPRLNKQGGRFGKATRYEQVRDVDHLGLTTAQKVDALYEQMTKDKS